MPDGRTHPPPPDAEPDTHDAPTSSPHTATRGSIPRSAPHRVSPEARPVRRLFDDACPVPRTFDRMAALYAQQCVSTHLLRSHSAYSNTETSTRSLTRLFDQRHGTEATISRDTLLHDGDGLLPTFFGSWWHPSYGALLVEDAHA
jgi:hypothetical protein